MKNRFFIAVASLFLSLMTPAHGHAGHDHNHWSADLLHYAFYISMAAMIIVVMYCMVKLLTVDSADNRYQQKSKIQS